MHHTLRPLFAAALCAGLLPSAALAVDATPADVADATRAHAALNQALADVDLGAIYGALPASYRSALADTAKTAAGKVDPAVWSAAQQLLLQASASLTKQARLLASMDEAKSALPIPQADAAANLDLTTEEKVTMLVRLGSRLGAVAKAADRDKIASGGLASVLAVPALTMKGVTDTVKPIQLPTYTAKAGADGTVTLTEDGKDTGDTMVKVEGVWIPAALVEAFADRADWKAQAAAIPAMSDQEKQGVLMAIQMMTGVARQAGKAQNADELRSALQQAMMPLVMMGMGAGLPGGGGDAPALPFPVQ